MSNDYFKFKQFIILQDRCAMKVSTDACILGAWFATKLGKAKSVLDIGSGTGLLMLMLAQKNNIKIEGIELDPACYLQLKENLSASIWNNLFEVWLGDARSQLFPGKYDFIISNPPFFENDLPSPSLLKNQAKHNVTMTLSELIRTIQLQLKIHGSFGLILPYQRMEEIIRLCRENQFFLIERLLIRQTPAHDYFRTILHFSRDEKEAVESGELIIKDEKGYTGAFIALMKDYYLYL